jgi:hypothetical protein
LSTTDLFITYAHIFHTKIYAYCLAIVQIRDLKSKRKQMGVSINA